MKKTHVTCPSIFWAACLCAVCGVGAAAAQTDATYEQYRFTPLKLRDDVAANSIQLSEFVFINDGLDLDLDVINVVVEVPGGDMPDGEPPEALLDGDTGTKWLNFNKLNPVIFTFQDGEGAPLATTIDAYTFATGGDAPERDPVSWTFEGSNDGIDWVLLDSQVDYPTTTVRNAYEPNFNLPDALFVTLQSVNLNRSGGTIVIADSNGESDPAGTFEVDFDLVTLDPSAVTVSKEAGITTVTFDATIDAQTGYPVEVTVPLIGGGTQTLDALVQSFQLPDDLAGNDGSVGTWALREYRTNTGVDVATSSAVATSDDPGVIEFVEAEAPVFNHSDPDSNGPRSSGNFNNDFDILSDTEPGVVNETGNDDWVVVGRTQVEVAGPGTYTFSVHTDDGFAMRVSGASGGRFVSSSGLGGIDPGDDQTILFNPAGGIGDSNTRGVYEFDAAGVYDILVLSWDSGSGGFYELAWAEGEFEFDRDTNTWELVGDPNDPTVLAIPYRARFVTNPPGPTGTENNFGSRTYLGAGAGIGSTEAASDFLATTTREPDGVLTVDAQLPYLNHRDPQDGGGGAFAGELPFPGNTTNNDDRVVTVAKGRISIPVTDSYTFWMQGDDGALLRFKGVDGNPDPVFKRATQGGNAADGRFEMSNLNELFFNGGGNPDTRGIIELAAGEYDIEFIHHEGVGGFHYELTAAPGEWPHGTTPPDGFQLVGFNAPAPSAIAPRIADPGWLVESSTPGRAEIQASFSIAGAELAINNTLADDTAPAEKVSTWDQLNFHDPENGPEGSFSPTNAWPLNTAADDNDYAMRATGTLVVDEAGTYFLGFQGDDGGYMYIDGIDDTPTPAWESIAVTNFPNDVRIEERVAGSGVNNAVRLEVGTGNSRTIARINLNPGEYRIQTLVYEGGGGSWWEVLGAKGEINPNVFNFPLLVTGENDGVIMTPSGLTLINQVIAPTDDGDFRISGFVTAGNPVTSASFEFPSEAGETYTVQASIDLVTWVNIGENVPAEDEGASTPFTAELVGTEFESAARVFFRVILNE